jgi:hypothetical protein
MTYSSGGLIQATDYNGFVSTTAGANINATWNTAYGQTALSTVAAAGTVTATQWASLVNTTASLGTHTNTTLTARSAPTAGTTISVLAAVNTDITNVFNNRYNAYAVGSQFTGWTGTNSYTGGRPGGAWNMQFNNLITWSSAAAAQYFFNAGGLIRIQTSKTSTGQTGDPEWNDLANTLAGVIWISGLGTSHTIAGTAYNGVTKIGGTGTPAILSSSLGWDNLTPGTVNQVIYQQYADTAPYTSNAITTYLTRAANSTTLNVLSVWNGSDGDPISGGTAPSGATPGTAPCTIVTYYPPETTTLTNTWGTPTVTASIV